MKFFIITTEIGQGKQLASMIEHRARVSTLSPLVIHRPGDGVGWWDKFAPIFSQGKPGDLKQALVDLVKQLGSEIRAQVDSSFASPRTQESNGAMTPPQSSTTVQQHDWSKVNLILKPEIKKPHFFLWWWHRQMYSDWMAGNYAIVLDQERL